MIYITGDVHGDSDRFKAVRKAGIKKRDVLFICGDFGFLWTGAEEEYKAVKKIGKHKYKIIFVDGYNENHKLIAELPQTEIFGGKARQLSGNLYCAERGEIFDVDGVKVFTFGGGSGPSSSEPEESDALAMPTAAEMQTASDNLNKVGDAVDIIITHDVPTRIRAFVDMDSYELHNLNAFLEDICQTVKFKQWYFGKYHENKLIPPCYNMLFTAVKKYEKK